MQKSLTRVSARAKRKVNEPMTPGVMKNDHAWPKPPKPIYALAAYTVEKRGQKWYVIKTAEQNAGRTTWRGPYLTLDRATLAIATLPLLGQRASQTREPPRPIDDFRQVGPQSPQVLVDIHDGLNT